MTPAVEPRMEHQSRTRQPRCPACKHTIAVEAGAPRPSWAPFCSERCKLIDLARWLNGENAIPGDPVSPEMLEE